MIDFLADLFAYGIVFGGATALSGGKRRRELSDEEISRLPPEEQEKAHKEKAAHEMAVAYCKYFLVHCVLFVIVMALVEHNSVYMYPALYYKTELILFFAVPPIVVLILFWIGAKRNA